MNFSYNLNVAPLRSYLNCIQLCQSLISPNNILLLMLKLPWCWSHEVYKLRSSLNLINFVKFFTVTSLPTLSLRNSFKPVGSIYTLSIIPSNKPQHWETRIQYQQYGLHTEFRFLQSEIKTTVTISCRVFPYFRSYILIIQILISHFLYLILSYFTCQFACFYTSVLPLLLPSPLFP